MESSTKVRPIDSFLLIFKVLALAGFYKHLVKPRSKLKYICHQMYRPVVLLIILAYNSLHLIYIYQTFNDIDTVLEVMMMELSQLNLLAKYLALNLGSSKLDKINEALTNNPMFLPKNKKDEEILTQDKVKIDSMMKHILVFAGFIAALWTTTALLKRLQNPAARLHIYMPFETDSWLGYSIAVILYTSAPTLWNAYGHLTVDCAIAAYYSQAETQLIMIQCNIERLVRVEDSDLEVEDGAERSSFQYRDSVNPNIKEQFVYYVKKYQKVVWYTEEVGKVLDKAIGCCFLSNSFGVCLIIFVMSSTGTNYLQLGFLTLFVLALLTQVFLYCYFGGMVTVQSSLLNTSIYKSDWYFLSPGFRRGMLIAMMRWSRPLVPRVNSFVVIPLSVGTFLVIVRFTYSLFTVLKAAKNQ